MFSRPVFKIDVSAGKRHIKIIEHVEFSYCHGFDLWVTSPLVRRRNDVPTARSMTCWSVHGGWIHSECSKALKNDGLQNAMA
jgi:hypothetical protein